MGYLIAGNRAHRPPRCAPVSAILSPPGNFQYQRGSAAEELECDWKKIRFEFAPNDKAYFNPIFGAQGTGGSMSTRGSWTPLFQAGASAREMLIAAAAQ